VVITNFSDLQNEKQAVIVCKRSVVAVVFECTWSQSEGICVKRKNDMVVCENCWAWNDRYGQCVSAGNNLSGSSKL